MIRVVLDRGLGGRPPETVGQLRAAQERGHRPTYLGLHGSDSGVLKVDDKRLLDRESDWSTSVNM